MAHLACCRALLEHMQVLGCIYSCTCEYSSREGRQLGDTAAPCQVPCKSWACVQQPIKSVSGCGVAAGDVVLRNNTVHHAYYQKDEGAAICAFATGLDDHPSGTSLQPSCALSNVSRVVILHSSLLASASTCLTEHWSRAFSKQAHDKMCKKAGDKCVGYLYMSFNAAAA